MSNSITVLVTHSEQYPGPEFFQLHKFSFHAEIFAFSGCDGIKIILTLYTKMLSFLILKEVKAFGDPWK